MHKVVSVSLGSSRRDKTVEALFAGERFLIQRIGTDGDFEKARRLIAELDGKVDAIGLGGIDLYLVAGRRRYVIRDALRLARAAHRTPVVDGSGLKHTLEREVIRYLAREGILPLKGRKVLLVSAVDRFGMAEALVEQGAQTLFGDFIFALGLPIPLRRLSTVRLLARFLLPILCRLPFTLLYPTGSKQEKSVPRHSKYYRWAEVIAGDFHFIRRYLPPLTLAPSPLEGKAMITNTVTGEDVDLLTRYRVRHLITTTPEFEGRSFGTNVMEGVLITLAGKRPEEMQEQDYLDWLQRVGWKPRIEELTPEGTQADQRFQEAR